MNVVTGVEMRQIDRYTMEEIGLSEELLMENAGQAFVNAILPMIDKRIAKIAVLIGVGNNGGDGFVISRSLLEKGYHVDVWLIPPMNKVKGTARYHMEVFLKSGYELQHLDGINFNVFLEYTHIIDALLGTGVTGSLRQPYRDIIHQLNQMKRTIISVDLPSGINADEHVDKVEAVKATYTISLQCPKLCAFEYPYKEYFGKLSTVDIGIPQLAIQHISNERFLWTEENVIETMPVRKPSSHKGSHGKGLIVAGSNTMTGAPILTAKACHRLGAGLVTLATPDVAHSIVASQVVEATFYPCPSKHGQLDQLNLSSDFLNNRYDAIAVGPGLGRDNDGFYLNELLIEYEKPLIIDADGLYYVKKFLPTLATRTASTILTPHIGEFAQLTDMSIAEIEKNKFQLSKQFAVQYGVYVVLKGPHTVVTTPKGVQYINTTGNASLAKGGSGDVLTGMILALIMQQSNLQQAISNAVYLHGKAAEDLTNRGWSPLSVVASDLVEIMPQVLERMESNYHIYR